MSAMPPGALINWIEQRFAKVDPVTGVLKPNASGTIAFYEIDGVTPKVTYSDPELTIPNTAVITLGTDGRPPTDIYSDRNGYYAVVDDSDATQLYTVLFEDTSGSFWADLAAQQAVGSKDVDDGYQVLATDNLVTTDAAAVGTPNLPLSVAANRTGLPLVIKNFAAVAWTVTPFGSDTIDNLTAGTAFSLPAAASGSCPAITLVPISGGWLIIATAFV